MAMSLPTFFLLSLLTASIIYCRRPELDIELDVLELHECPYQFEPVGCFKDSRFWRTLPDQIINSRDGGSAVFQAPHLNANNLNQWTNYHHWLANFACKCAVELFKKKPDQREDYIGLQFYAECWASLQPGSDHARLGEATECVDSGFKAYTGTPSKCGLYVGEATTSFVYKVTKYYRTCPEINGWYEDAENKSVVFSVQENINVVGAYVKGIQSPVKGILDNGCQGTLIGGKKFEYNSTTCEFKVNGTTKFTKLECEGEEECPFFKSKGCLKDASYLQKPEERSLTMYAFNERDASAANWNKRFIEWGNWGTGYLTGLLCRCAKRAKQEKQKFFAIQYYGECWLGNNATRIARDGLVSNCVDSKWDVCPVTDKMCKPNPCAGQHEANKVYEIHQGPDECLSDPCPDGKKCVTNGSKDHDCV